METEGLYRFAKELDNPLWYTIKEVQIIGEHRVIDGWGLGGTVRHGIVLRTLQYMPVKVSYFSR